MRHAVRRACGWAEPLLLAGSVAVGSATAAAAHPLHTTVTDIGYRRESGVVRATIRVFADDFGRAVLGLGANAPAPAGTAVSDSAAAAYLRRHLILTGADGRTLPLRWCGLRRSGDLVWLCVETAYGGGPAGPRLMNRMLFELYRDQVNIVQVTAGGQRHSLLFVAGDPAKSLLAGG